MWILSKGRKLFDTTNEWKANIGPGKYHKNKKKNMRVHSDWGKNVRFNYEKLEKKE